MHPIAQLSILERSQLVHDVVGGSHFPRLRVPLIMSSHYDVGVRRVRRFLECKFKKLLLLDRCALEVRFTKQVMHAIHYATWDGSGVTF